MKLCITDIKLYLKENLPFFDEDSYRIEYSVHAIVIFKKEKNYLVYGEHDFKWLSEKYVKILDSRTPLLWEEKVFKKSLHLKSEYYPEYIMKINYFFGPIEFLNNREFFYDIYEDWDKAYNFFMDVKNKNEDADH